VIAASLPALGYLTTLDKYVLGVFGGISLVILEVALIEWISDDEDERESLREHTAIADSVLWLVRLQLHLPLFECERRGEYDPSHFASAPPFETGHSS
jgi:hypothetical protein